MNDESNIIVEILKLPLRNPGRAMPEAVTETASQASLSMLVREKRAYLAERAATGDGLAAAVLSLGGGWSEPNMILLVDRILQAERAQAERASGGPWLWEVIWTVANECYGETRADLAAMAFGILRGMGSDLEAEALCGLAICAVATNRNDDAHLFAQAALAQDPRNSRACCIAGYCALARGNRKSAQGLLAMATRLARRNPQDRHDMQAAQRLLLTLHFG